MSGFKLIWSLFRQEYRKKAIYRFNWLDNSKQEYSFPENKENLVTTLNQCKKLHILTISLEDLEASLTCLLNRADQRTLSGPSLPAADLRTV